MSYAPWVPAGIKRAHRKGFTGKGITIGVRDSYVRRQFQDSNFELREAYSHGETVEQIIRSFAPDVTIIRNPTLFQIRDDVDIVTQSQGSVWIDSRHYDSFWNTYNLNWSNVDCLKVTCSANYDRTPSYENNNYFNTNAVEHCWDWDGEKLNHRPNNTGIIVGGTNHDHSPITYGIKAGFTAPDYLMAQSSAPSVFVGDTWDNWKPDNGGTSWSTPKVAAVAALLMEAYPELSTLDIKKAILEGTSNIRGYDESEQGHGRLNVNRSFSKAKKLNKGKEKEVTPKVTPAAKPSKNLDSIEQLEDIIRGYVEMGRGDHPVIAQIRALIDRL